jgi:ribose transport system ATP-binding protein
LHDVNLRLRRGEVLGLAGLMGSGRTELARALFGIDRADSGELLLNGKPAPLGDPSAAIDAGVALIPEDRRVQGLVLDHSVYDNVTLPMLGRLTRAGIVDDAQAAMKTDEAISRLSVAARSARQAVRELSGGNQQKVVIGKWLGMDPQILIMDEPTAGVDIGTKAEIVGMIRDFADNGGSVIMISSELPELLAVSDRLLILREGRVESEIDRRQIRREEDLHHAVQGIGA